MPITLKEIARRTDKSITTVSRALADYDDVSPETKALVRRVAEELGYTPNLLAQRLQRRRSDTLGLILPTFGPRFSDPFFSEFLAGIGNMAAEHGYDLLVSTQEPGERELQVYRQKVQSRQVDGFVIVRTRRQDARITYLREIGFPFVAFGRTEGEIDFSFVDVDGARGMQMIGEYLIGLGHRHIACLAPPPDLFFAEHRLAGLRHALETHGLDPHACPVVLGDLTQKSGYEATLRLLEYTPRPTAIAACNDLMALGALSAIHERGLAVGKDIAVTGFDGIPMAEHFHPPLTTIYQPIYQIGKMVCEELIQIICGESQEPRQVILEPQLLIRKSCGNAPK
ncbi:MAG: LacI family DNA-binding transcriptional regulator [Anaerolineae bacterium]|nr:LacI family DNA-binding transcriptional regulator [Anaerolineae bacterium]HXK43479.1 LacI family DNA-binding transcriptional regulator [Anaerolineae bacterium]